MREMLTIEIMKQHKTQENIERGEDMINIYKNLLKVLTISHFCFII